jgi:hypothetical protein
MVAFLAACTFTSLVSAGEEPKKLTDEEITKRIVGKWAVDEGDGKAEPKIKGTMTYKKDGKVDAEATIEVGKNSVKVSLSGTWKVSDGVITSTVTKTNVPDLIKEGFVSKDKVISINDKEYKYKDEKDNEKTQKRVKDEEK